MSLTGNYWWAFKLAICLEKESYQKGIAPAGVVSYTYDGASNRATMTDTRSGQLVSTAYTYDQNNRLYQARESLGGVTQRTEHYTYDKNGNQLSYSAGFFTTVITGPLYQENEYNSLGQLVSVDNQKHQAEYTYNPSGLRHSKTVDGGRTVHAWDGSDIIIDKQGLTAMLYVRGYTLLWSRDYTLQWNQDSSTRSVYLYNAHGDVVEVVGSKKSTNYSYDAFGNQLNADGTPAEWHELSIDITNPFRYCGEYTDYETGYVYLRARYYDPTTSRMLSEDPARAGLNWYVYCENDPVNRIDPSGLDSYVLYDPNDVDNGFVTKEKAEIMKAELEEQYGTPCHLI